MTEQTSADKNEAIARWMQKGHLYFCEECGDRWGERPEVGKQPLISGREVDIPKSHTKNGAVCRGPVLKDVSAYERSLDSLVPVMEALREKGCEVVLRSLLAVGYGAYVEGYSDYYSEATRSFYSGEPAEALRDAIYAALVAMGVTA